MKKVILAVGFIFLLAFSFTITPINAVFATNEEDFEIKAKACYLIDYNTEEVLYKNNETQKLPVASIVKLMTILITIENLEAEKINLDDVVVASSKAASMGGSQVFIEEGGSYTIGDMLKSVIVSSANDASVVLAETIAGSEESFVQLMNERAKELGLTNTQYSNCTGLPASNQFSCAKDIAILLKTVASHDLYHNYSTIWMDKLKHKNDRETELVNTNKLIRYFKGCDGGKTGSTNEAGYCLAATAKRGEMRLIGVVLGASSGTERFSQTSNLLNYGFNNFENKKLVSKDYEVENQVQVFGGKKENIKLNVQNDMFLLTKKVDKSGSVTTKIELPKTIKAPIKKGDIIGTMYLIKDDQVVKSENIVSSEDIQKATFVDNIYTIIDGWKIA